MLLAVCAGVYYSFFAPAALPVRSEVSSVPTASPSALPASNEPAPDPKLLAECRFNYAQGLMYLEKKNYKEAKTYLSGVLPLDAEHYSDAQAKLADCNSTIIKDYLNQGQALIDKTFYLKASNLLDQALKEFPDNKELITLKNNAAHLAAALVKYEGPVYHVFFHSLIVYPELCFTGDGMEQGYNDWMTTVREFKLMLQEMYDRGYTLIDLRDMFSTDAAGKVVQNDIMLPKGKKPLIISVDDVSYYKYMEKDGFAEKLVLDDKGEVATLVKTPQGNEIVTRDGDVVPILDDFVKENPDFSYKGAKGILAITGYEGILGYRTIHNNPDWEKEQAKVQPVVDKLKATGWAFACHSFTHRRSYSERTITLGYLKYDMERWLKEVGSIVGPTNLYIAPFGASFPQEDERLKYIVSKGFHVYCGVGSRPYYHVYGNNVFMERIDLDGYKMVHSPEVMKELFNVEKVYDPARPPMLDKKKP
ncbi:MAG: hypothetical protein N2376_01665 [Clostridia bacterium]|nr:hypothetical protein [Clostridia bacterium]